MKMTKELKEIILKGFVQKLDLLLASERITQNYENSGNKEESNERRKRRNENQGEILKAIEGLIEVEGE